MQAIGPELRPSQQNIGSLNSGPALPAYMGTPRSTSLQEMLLPFILSNLEPPKHRTEVIEQVMRNCELI